MDKDKAKQEISVLGRLFSIEAFLFLMGIVSFVSWFYTREVTQLFWGVMIIGGSVALHFVRKKDWKKHWEEQERERQFYEELARAKKEREKEKEKGDGGK